MRKVADVFGCKGTHIIYIKSYPNFGKDDLFFGNMLFRGKPTPGNHDYAGDQEHRGDAFAKERDGDADSEIEDDGARRHAPTSRCWQEGQ